MPEFQVEDKTGILVGGSKQRAKICPPVLSCYFISTEPFSICVRVNGPSPVCILLWAFK